jgi:flagellar FliL protein
VSTAAATAGSPPKGKKKLIVIVAAVLLIVFAGAGGLLLMKKKSQDDEDAGDDAPAHAVKHDPKAIPTFVPLELFTVNLADREAERYAQVGITLEVVDAHAAEQVKAYMPAIRNQILLALADRTAIQLMERDGKTKLAEQVRRATCRAMGFEVDDEDEEAAEPAKSDEESPKKPKKKRKKAPALPVTAVHFSNFIIQ